MEYWDPLYYYFNEVGEYDVEIELIDPTLINPLMFYYNDEGIRACLTSVVIPDSVTSIGYQAFYDCSSLTSVNISNNLTYIESQCFERCSGLTSIVIPDSVTSIGDSAFSYCSSLTSVNIGSGVTTIYSNAFKHCSGLNEITCNAITAPEVYYDTFKDVKEGGVLKVPAGSDYSTWMSTDDQNNNYGHNSGYLSEYNWTIEYI